MKPIRVRLSRAKGSRLPPNTVSVARPTKFGNPYRIGSSYRTVGAQTYFVMDRKHAVELFELAVRGELPTDYRYGADPVAWFLYLADAKRKLRGKNLACWCPLDEPCHADTLLRIVNA